MKSTCYGISTVENMSDEEWLKKLGILPRRRENSRIDWLVHEARPQRLLWGTKWERTKMWTELRNVYILVQFRS